MDLGEIINKSGVSLDRTFEMQSRYKDNVIYLTEFDEQNPMVVAHEFGHYMLDVQRENNLEEFKQIKEKAQDYFQHSYIYDNYIDDLKRNLNEIFHQKGKKIMQEEENKINELIQNGDVNELFIMTKKSVLYCYNVRGSYNEEEIDNITLNIMNSKYFHSFLRENLVQRNAYGRTILEISLDPNTKGMLMLSDLFSSLNDGNYYNFDLPFHHNSDYYEKNETYSFEEQFANFTSLKLNGCEKELEIIKAVLGNEYYEYMNDYFQKKIEQVVINKQR